LCCSDLKKVENLILSTTNVEAKRAWKADNIN
jgi:hypothetical protein